MDEDEVPLKLDDGRWRLDFPKVDAQIPELAFRTKLIRSRVSSLRSRFHRDARLARIWFHLTNFFAAIAAMMLMIYGLWIEHIVLTTYLLAVFGTLGALCFTIVNSMGLHRRYQAMSAAGWSIATLNTEIDNHILQMVIDLDGKEFSSENRDEIVAKVDGWNEKMSGIIDIFGTKVSDSLRPVHFKVGNVGSARANAE